MSLASIPSFDLSGRVALVAGGSGNIGRAICIGLARHGAEVIVTDLVQSHCDDVIRHLPASESAVHQAVGADLSIPSGIDMIMECCRARGRLDIVVHCVGLTSSTPLAGYAVPFEQQTLEAWERAVNVNLTSAFLLAKGVNDLIRQSSAGSFILLSSIYGMVGPRMELYESTGMGNPIAYGVSKGGILQLMRYLATLWAPAVRVNCVSSGGVERGQDSVFVKRYEQQTPMRRMANVGDVVGPVLFLAGDAARYVTGQNLAVDGGWTCW